MLSLTAYRLEKNTGAGDGMKGKYLRTKKKIN